MCLVSWESTIVSFLRVYELSASLIMKQFNVGVNLYLTVNQISIPHS
ncbi:hypothetical protein PCIT_a0371 [Pseudoalteromonas citrea]|uniref:Uncharacterized protein n=1 Tax=Pseudoalteromonas citrea TaxID=43655 RepID=A0AAD4AKI9_9GAMM|nr:hypothetical protein PCIT_a0371 [Pseudoalteromonas citrea]